MNEINFSGKNVLVVGGSSGIGNGIAPGLVATKITKVTWGHPRRYEDSLKEIPLHRWGAPEEMGGVTMFLASSLSSYVTGQMILVDGGMGLA